MSASPAATGSCPMFGANPGRGSASSATATPTRMSSRSLCVWQRNPGFPHLLVCLHDIPHGLQPHLVEMPNVTYRREKEDTQYDADGEPTLTITKQRDDNDPTTGSDSKGDLTGPTSDITASRDSAHLGDQLA